MIKTLLCTAALLTLTACGGGDKPAKRGKIDMKTDVRVERGAEPMKLGEVLIPASQGTGQINIVGFPMNTTCTLPRASYGAKVINVASYEGGQKRSPLFFAQEHPETKRVTGGYELENAHIANIIVTDTSAPLYLVFTSHNSTLWVVHAAPNVEIEAVSVISFEPSGLAGVGTAQDRIGFIKRAGHDYMASARFSSGPRDCYRKPIRYFNAAEQTKVQPANYTRTPEDYAQYRVKEKAYTDWLIWLGKNVGHAVDLDFGDYRIDAALIGPTPAQPVQAVPISGPIYVSPEFTTAFWGSKKDARAQYPERKQKKKK